MARRSSLKADTGRVNIISDRLRVLRHRSDPPMTVVTLSALIQERTDYRLTANALNKIEVNLRPVYDFEVAAICEALRVNPDFLLGLTDDPRALPPES